MSNSTIVDPNSVQLVFTGQSAIGSGGGMPTEGVHGVTATEATIRQNDRGLSLWLTMTTDGGYKLYDYHALPTAENATQATKFGTKAEFFEKKLKAVLVAFGHSPDGVKNMVGTPPAKQILDLLLTRKGFIFYRPPVGGGKHQIDYIGSTMVDKVRSGEVTFQDRRMGAGTSSGPVVAPMGGPTNGLGMTSPQPPGGMVLDGIITGPTSVTL